MPTIEPFDGDESDSDNENGDGDSIGILLVQLLCVDRVFPYVKHLFTECLYNHRYLTFNLL